MVKGVNKTIIEVNDTGSEMFDKIILYVSPKYGHLTMPQLQKAMEDLSIYGRAGTPLRKRVRLRKKRVALLSLGVIGMIVAVILAAVL